MRRGLGLGCGLLLLLLLTTAREAAAVSLVAEVTASRTYTALSLLSELELAQDRTYLTLCYGTTRTAALEIQGVDRPVDVPRTHQLCAGLDHALDDHFRLNAFVSGSPKITNHVELLGPPNTLYFRSQSSSLGASAGLSYDSAGLSDVEFGLDGALSVTGYSLPHMWVTAERTIRVPGGLVAIRPSLGVMLLLGSGTELSLRGTYVHYLGDDPLTAGRVSEEELSWLSTAFSRGLAYAQFYGLSELVATFIQAHGKLLMADALSGLASAPVRLEVRPSIQHRFTSWLRGQLGYTYDRYVPTQGASHLLSTRWTFSPGDAWSLWVAVAVQWDLPEGYPGMTSGLLTLGAEVTF